MPILAVKTSEFDAAAAQLAVDQIRMKRNSAIGFATGNTTNGFHRALARKIIEENVDVSQITAFNLDETVGLPDTHPSRGICRLKEQLYDPIALEPGQIRYFTGTTGDLEQECRDFEAAIARVGGIDLQFIGIGTNGHIAFCEPGTPFHSGCHVVQLNGSQRESIRAKFHFASLDEVPSKGLTMGIKTIMHVKHAVLMAKGSDKADIVRTALFGPVTTEVPASVLQLHPNLTVLLDEAAAGQVM
ncbi:hypothetical protein SD70_10535 [Gordoniibacillus kamchatkensis]|uniref:Glucosamine/galactosamine-6-phosphate isomerase domain-containing protein n=1 Tax=Gordoniibacillus kamchatkensis TaxID=1590651 RepID=A0ABR5AIU2_9BACL|nr:glucosamine-6-phosphate deaminase [Paenibacillus sp. VKM B-2647]KIL40865.1 hypothetical protein SD70_10535 [Paenibacillus sp. VKM B-2647]